MIPTPATQREVDAEPKLEHTFSSPTSHPSRGWHLFERSLKEYHMNQSLFILLSAAAILACGCDSPGTGNRTEVDVVVDVWDPSNPVDGKMNGDWDSRKVEVYLDDEYLGSTPLRFTSAKRLELGLPEYRSIEIDEKRHWVTWDYNGRDSVVIAHPESRESKKRLHFKTTFTPQTDVQPRGMKITRADIPRGAEITMWLPIPKSQSEQDGTEKPAIDPESKPEAKEKPKPESEGRSR